MKIAKTEELDREMLEIKTQISFYHIVVEKLLDKAYFLRKKFSDKAWKKVQMLLKNI